MVAYKGELVVTNFSGGEIYQIGDNGKELVTTVEMSSADIGIDTSSETLFVPFLFKGKVGAYKIR